MNIREEEPLLLTENIVFFGHGQQTMSGVESSKKCENRVNDSIAISRAQ